jgi:CHRD domain-containing protein
MTRHWWAATMLVAAVLVLCSARAHAQEFSAKFSGFNEIGALNNETGAILSEGQGTLHLHLDTSAHTLTFELTYAGLSAPVTQAHIHFGKVHVPGGIVVFFCTNLGNGPAGTQPCPADGGTVTGTITAADVLAISGQHVTAGDFDALTDMLTAHSAYGNIHTQNFPAGEIRGEIRRSEGDDE